MAPAEVKTANYDAAIATAIADDVANNELTDGAPQQAVVPAPMDNAQPEDFGDYNRQITGTKTVARPDSKP